MLPPKETSETCQMGGGIFYLGTVSGRIGEVEMLFFYRLPNCQKATALAAATFKESTPCDMGIRTV